LGSVGSINSYIANSIGVFIAGILFVSIGASGTLIISGAIVFIQSFIYLMMRE